MISTESAPAKPISSRLNFSYRTSTQSSKPKPVVYRKEKTVVVPLCNNVKVKCTPDPNNLGRWLVNPVIYHPKVHPNSGILFCQGCETPEQLLTNEATFFGNPMNLDAAIELKQDVNAFRQKILKMNEIAPLGYF